MGNCQAIDNATLVIQHPNGGRVDKLYRPISAAEVMESNPGHYVALLLTTTLYSSSSAAKDGGAAAKSHSSSSSTPLRVTRIKLLRATDTLVLGHVYRLVTSQEVMKGLWAKKQAKMQHQQQQGFGGKTAEKQSSDFESLVRRSDVIKTRQVKEERQRSRNNTQVNCAASKSRGWQPALNSISESAS